MLKSSFLKFYARQELKGEYLRVFIGALVAVTSSYIMSSVTNFSLHLGVGWYMLGILLSVLVTIFVKEIFTVSFIKSLMRMKPVKETFGEEKRYEPESVLSGFAQGYSRTLKITFIRQLYLFGWGLLMFVPLILVIGIISYLSNTTEMSELMNLIAQFQLSPTDDMALYVGNYIAENCSYVVPLIMGAYVLMLILAIPAIYKKYEYIMIPFIVADNPDITVKEAFARTREMMHGYRRKYFYVELSFIVLMLIPNIAVTQSVTLTYLAMAAITPYMTMTYIGFYRERKIMLTPIEEGENNNEN